MSTIRWPLMVRKVHKWLALFVGIQVVLWTITGFYMVVVHIDFIHGDHLVRAEEQEPYELASLLPVEKVIALAPAASEVSLATHLDRQVWKVRTKTEVFLLDGRTGDRLPALTAQEVEQVATRLYGGEGKPVSVKLLAEAPMEMNSRKPPFWQVEFPGWTRPTLYISPTSGELISKRHMFWRIFDFAWMLHIMDYDERSDVNNPLLRVATWSAFAMAVSGAWLLLWAFPRRKKKKAK